MTSCIFCRIAGGEIPAAKVYEDERVVGFLDIAPINPGHVLIIPRHHSATIFDAPEEDLSAMIAAAKKVGAAVMAASGASGLNVGINNHPSSGQVVFHVHLHLIPRHDGDGFKHWPHKQYKQDEMEEVAERIRGKL